MTGYTSKALSGRRAFLYGLACCGAATTLPVSVLAAAPYQQSELFMGTIVRIDVTGASTALACEAVARAFARGRQLEALLTRFDSTSPLCVLNAQGSLSDVPPVLITMLRQSAAMHRLTEGNFDPSVLPVLLAMREAEEAGAPLGRADIAGLMDLVGYGRVRFDSGVSLDAGMALTLDGIAKGYIAQEMSRTLIEAGCPNHLVNAGGDVIAHGSSAQNRAWRVGVRSPFDAAGTSAVVIVRNRALASSGVYEQPVRGAGGSHLVIPARTLSPRTGIVACSVLAGDGAAADALATAFSVMAPGSVLRLCRSLPDVEALLVLDNGGVVASDGWPA